MIRRILSKTKVKESVLIFVSIVFLIFAYWFLFIILEWALQYNWLFPFVSIILIGILIFLGLQDLKSPEAKYFPIRKGVTIFILMIMTASLGFGSFSFWLTTQGWANYSLNNLDLLSYNIYYLWLFLDMIPVLKLNETLGFVAPLQPIGFIAGLPILAFRALVIFELLKSLKTWWDNRNEKSNKRKHIHTMKLKNDKRKHLYNVKIKKVRRINPNL